MPSSIASYLDLAASIDRRLFRNIQVPTRLITGPGSFSIDPLDRVVLVNAAAGAVTITLPSASGIGGMVFEIKKRDSTTNPVNIVPQPGQFIDGISKLTLRTVRESLVLESDGSDWRLLSGLAVFGTVGINVCYMGAVGDGVADDTAAIQSAIDTGMTVFFPPGVYHITAPLVVSSAGQKIQGSGRQGGVCVIRSGGTPSSPLAAILKISANRVAVSDIELDGVAQANTTTGILFHNGARSVIERFNLAKCGTGIKFDTNSGTPAGNNNLAVLRDGIVSQCNLGIESVWQANNNGIVLDGMEASSCTSHGVRVRGVGWRILHGMYQGNGGYGIVLGDSGHSGYVTGCTIITPWLEGNASGGIRGEVSTRNLILQDSNVQGYSTPQASDGDAVLVPGTNFGPMLTLTGELGQGVRLWHVKSPYFFAYLQAVGSLALVLSTTDSTKDIITDNAKAFRPGPNNVQLLGLSSNRWKEFYVGAGTEGSPSISVGEAGTGMYLRATQKLVSTLNGLGDFFCIGTTGPFGYAGVSVSSYGWIGFSSTTNFSGTADVLMFRDAPGILALRNWTNAQTLRIYKTFTDGANYERVSLGLATVFGTQGYTLVTENSGTGSAIPLSFGTSGTPSWGINTSGHFLPTSDNTYEIGSDARRVKRGRFVTVVTGDLELHDPQSGAHWLIREEVDKVVFVNQKTGKTYRVMLEEE